MSVRSRVRRAHREEPELNITAFMNLMVALVPFLLITAVFSHLTVLELNLPPDNNQAANPEQLPELNFEVIVRKDDITVGDTLGGVIKVMTKTNDKYDFAALSDLLTKIKAKYPEKQNITILLEPDVPYDVLVQAMDTARVVSVVEAASVVKKELFPLIAIGDAP